MNHSFSSALRNADPNARIIEQNGILTAGGHVLPDGNQATIVAKLLRHGADLTVRDVAGLVASGGFRGIHWSDNTPQAVPVYRSRYLDQEYSLKETAEYTAACLESNFRRDPESEGADSNIVRVTNVAIVRTPPPANAIKAIVPGIERHVAVDGLAQMFLEAGETYPAYLVKRQIRRRNAQTKEFEQVDEIYAIPLWHKPMRLTGGLWHGMFGNMPKFYADQLRAQAKRNEWLQAPVEAVRVVAA